MALLGALTGAVGLWNSINQNNAANARQREADRQQAAALKAQKDYVDRLLASYQQSDASGAFNSDAREQHLNALFDNSLKSNLGNTNVALHNAGARPGDSSYEVQDKNVSEKNALARSGAILDTRDRANALRQQALESTNPSSYSNLLYNASNTNYNHGYQSQTDPSQLIGNIASMFGSHQQQSYDPYSMGANPNQYAPGEYPNPMMPVKDNTKKAY